MPEPGTHIRLTARVPEGKRWLGSFVSLASETVTLHDGGLNGPLVTVPTLHIERWKPQQRPEGGR
jgi:hypothetical protein